MRKVVLITGASSGIGLALCGRLLAEDIQHSKGREPYSSSKYATDLLNVALNRNFNQKGLYSSVMCPGVVMTNMTYGILPPFIWTLLLPIMWLVWLFHQKPESLNPLTKYASATSGFGTNYVTGQKMDIDEDTAEKFYEVLLELEKRVRTTVQKSDHPS